MIATGVPHQEPAYTVPKAPLPNTDFSSRAISREGIRATKEGATADDETAEMEGAEEVNTKTLEVPSIAVVVEVEEEETELESNGVAKPDGRFCTRKQIERTIL